MPGVYVTGPAGIFVASSNGNSLAQLGVCENGVQIAIQPTFDRVMNDLAGNQLPLDYLFQGCEAQVAGTLTVLSWTILENLAKMPFYGASVAGVSQFGEIGTLMGIEGASPQIWIKFPYKTKGVFADMVDGYHFYAAKLIGPTIIASTGAAKVPIAFQCFRKYFGAPANNVAAGSFLLYDHSMTGISFP